MSYLCYTYIIIYIGKTKASRGEGQRLDDLPSFPPRARPLPSPPSGGKGKVEQKSKQKGRKRENQGEGCRRHLRQFLASLLIRLMSSPSTPSPAAHHFARLCQHSGRGTGGHLVRFRAMPSPHLATTSAPIDQQSAATGQRLDGLQSCPPRPLPRPLFPVVMVGHRASQGVRFPPAHPVDPPPCRGGAWAYGC